MADENMVQKAVDPRETVCNSSGEEWENDEDNDNHNQEEYEAINAQLDQLNSALDSLERKNDSIHAELVELLQSNREARQQFQKIRDKPNSTLQNV